MTEKPVINLIYGPRKDPERAIRYDGPEGKVLLSNRILKGGSNVFNCPWSFYYMQKPQKETNNVIWILEPRAVNDCDYNIDYLDNFKLIFTWNKKAFEGTKIQDRVVYVNHPSCLGHPDLKVQAEKKWKSWKERNNELVVIANKKDSNHPSSLYWLRIKVCDLLLRHSNIPVSWYGQTIPKKEYAKGTIPNKFQVLNNVRFTLCSENCYDEKWSHGYFTEKLCDAWFAGAVPLYMGCHNIDEFGFGPNSYIDMRKFVDHQNKKVNFKDLVNELKSFDEVKYKKMYEEVLDKADVLYEHISYERAYKTMLNAINFLI